MPRSNVRIYKWIKTPIGIPIKGTLTDRDVVEILQALKAARPVWSAELDKAISTVQAVAAAAAPLDIKL